MLRLHFYLKKKRACEEGEGTTLSCPSPCAVVSTQRAPLGRNSSSRHQNQCCPHHSCACPGRGQAPVHRSPDGKGIPPDRSASWHYRGPGPCVGRPATLTRSFKRTKASGLRAADTESASNSPVWFHFGLLNPSAKKEADTAQLRVRNADGMGSCERHMDGLAFYQEHPSTKFPLFHL